jgi:hypothetical protein
MSLNDKQGIQLELRTALTTSGEVGIPRATPINASDATETITAGQISACANGDTVTFDGVVYTKAATLDAPANEWETAANLATLISASADWGAVEGAGAVVITATLGGVVFNSRVIESTSTVTTSGGEVAAKATATIAAASIGALLAGDTITFDGETFTYVATAPGVDEFTNVAELVALIDALTDWTAAVNTGACVITAAANGVAFNGIKAVTSYGGLVTSGGINGTFGVVGAVLVDNTNIYMAPAGSTVNTKGWRKIAHGSL